MRSSTLSRAHVLPQVSRGVPRARGWHGRVAGAAELAQVEGQEARSGAGERGGDEDEVRVHREVGEAAAVRQQRLARVAVGLVLPHGVLDVLAVEPVLQLAREDRDAVQEEDQIQALLVLRAVAELADRGEEVRRVQAPRLLVEPARRPEAGEAEGAARVLDAGPQHVEGAAPADLSGEAGEELLLHRHAVVLG
jgi:hypothetical protein